MIGFILTNSTFIRFVVVFKYLVTHTIVTFYFSFFGAPKPSADVRDRLIATAKAGYKKIEQVIERNGGDYILGSQLTICDFYMTVWCILLLETGSLTLDDNPTLSAWYDRMMEIPQPKKARNGYRKMFKMGKFMMTYIMPVMKCCTCQCCCPKKK